MTQAYLLDTNSVIYALKLGLSITPNYHHISVITELELLSYHRLSESDEVQLRQLLSLFIIDDITPEIKTTTIQIRREHRLKLPDSIILATAQVAKLPLITADQKLLNVAGKNGVTLEHIIL